MSAAGTCLHADFRLACKHRSVCIMFRVTVNSEVKNMASVTFSKQLGLSRLQDTWTTLDEQYGGTLWFIMYFLMFESLSPFTTIVLEITETPFSCETPTLFCKLKNFIMYRHEGEQIMT